MASVPVEQQIVEKLRLLDDAAKQRVLALIEHEAQSQSPQAFSLTDWLEQTQEMLQTLRAKYGADYMFGGDVVLDEIREESSWPLSSS